MKRFLYLLLLILVVIACNDSPLHQDSIPPHTTFAIASKQLSETRTINVWTPPGYATGVDSLPVLYMLDGGIKEDFPHIANTVSKLIENQSIPPTILVGIENTERRRDLTGKSDIPEDGHIAPVTDGAIPFRAFIKNELFPAIHKKYSTNSIKGIIGESVAGLFIVETILLHPEMFDCYIAMDPSLWWNNHYLVRSASALLADFPNQEIRFWFAGSGAADISIHTNELSTILQLEAPSTLIWTYANEPNEKHSTIFRSTKEKALIWALNKKSIH